MSESSENEGAIQKRSADQYLTYAKWGLMGIGGLWVAKVAIGLVLNPIVLVGAAGLGAAGWFLTKGRGKSSPKSEPAAATGVGAASAEETLRREAEAEAEAELSGVPAPQPARAPAPSTAAPSETPLEEFDRRLADLERLKAKMADD